VERQLDAAAPDGQVAEANREQLSRAGVFTVNLICGPGCGKTSLLQATLQRLVLKRRVGVLTAERYSPVDADRLAPLGDQVLRVDPGGQMALTARQVRPALALLNLPALDILLIENISSLIGPSGVDLGRP
jgi:hydrogenase nickel incorporation protein HypB